MKKHYGNQPDFFNKISSQRYLIEKHLVDYKEGNPENQKSIFCTPKKSGASHPILTVHPSLHTTYLENILGFPSHPNKTKNNGEKKSC